MKKEQKWFVLLAFAAFLPYCLYGFRYFPILDDYIQYWAYPARQDFSLIYLTYGTLATRPIASLLDVTFWGQLWPVLPLALFFITLLLVLSGLFMKKTANLYNLSLSPLFFLLLFLLPVGMEGRFWLSASSRLVVGLFFASLSLYVGSHFMQKKRSVPLFLLFAILQLISCGFYESVAVFSVSAAVLLFCLSFSEQRKKLLFLVPAASVCNISLLFGYYKLFADLGLQGSRAASVSASGLADKIGVLFVQLGEVGKSAYSGLVGGFFSGIRVLFRAGVWGVLLFALILLTGLLLGFLYSKQEQNKQVRIKKWLIFELGGFFLFVAPLIPNLLAEEVWITHRSVFISLIGLALMLEPVFCLLPHRLRRLVLVVLSFMLLTATVNEYDVYRRVHEADCQLLDRVIAEMSMDAKNGTEDVVVLLPGEVKTEQNAYYKDHVKSVFGSDWSLTGAVRARMESLAPRYIRPVLPGEAYETENSQIIDLR
ncbi:MAG: hypothetical protein E7402_05055 [Ruminococcaceae bacterium]|nr:hypothetical protein [Oscillospiraceae bacterium]